MVSSTVLEAGGWDTGTGRLFLQVYTARFQRCSGPMAAQSMG